jgi:rhamnogalacturonan endolyase
MHVSWRLLATDSAGLTFNLYRDGARLNPRPITGATSFVDPQGRAGAVYTVRSIVRGREQGVAKAKALPEGHLTIPLAPPPGGVTPAGEAFAYEANDASVGDLDGDGAYEVVLKWNPTNAKDNAFGGYTGNVFFDAYRLDGRRLWRIDLGRNIRAGAHYTQFLVYDFDGDGRAEMIAKTADGTVDGLGKVIGDANADWRGTSGQAPQADRTGATTLPDGTRVARLEGRILKGPEFLTVFDGATGRALATKPYAPPRHPETTNPTWEQLTAVWGDGYGNRSDRFLAGVAYLDGALPSAVMARGYYTRSTLAAWDWRGGELTQRWLFDSDKAGGADYAGQGNHQLSVADVDADGRDEIVYGSMAIDHDGRPLWSAKLHHGDAMHLSDLDPSRPGLEKFGVHESPARNGGVGAAMLDARTGEVLWTTPADKDIGRGAAFDIDPRFPGAEAWAYNSPSLYDAKGRVVSETRPEAANFGIWWDGDDQRELLDKTRIDKWDAASGKTVPLLLAEGVASNNGTKATPTLSADILGDWREEVIWRTEDSRALRIYVTPHPTQRRLPTLMHDPVYRLGVAWQNTAYNQPPHLSFDLASKPR